MSRWTQVDLDEAVVVTVGPDSGRVEAGLPRGHPVEKRPRNIVLPTRSNHLWLEENLGRPLPEDAVGWEQTSALLVVGHDLLSALIPHSRDDERVRQVQPLLE